MEVYVLEKHSTLPIQRNFQNEKYILTVLARGYFYGF